VSDRDTKVSELIDLMDGLQEVAFDGCGYCLIAPEDRDEVLALLRSLQPASGEKAKCPSCNGRKAYGPRNTPCQLCGGTGCAPPTEQAKGADKAAGEVLDLLPVRVMAAYDRKEISRDLATDILSAIRPSPPTAPAAGMTEADASTIERGALACDAVSKTYREPWRAQIWRTHAAELRSLAARLGGGKS
jgi:hypothetical protein